MKRSTLSLLALSATLITAGYVLGQAAKPGAPAPDAAKQQKLVRVATINGVQANREFQANVQFLQAQRQKAVELTTAVETEKDAKKKKELKSQLDALTAKLLENNEKMHKAYGFSLARNYTMEIETSHIYMQVTDEEAAKLEKAQAEAAKSEKTSKGKK